MPLIIKIEPGEKLSIGEAVISFDALRSRLSITGDIPVLREKDVMSEEDANSPCKEIYFLIQRMYASSKPEDYLKRFSLLLRDTQKNIPDALDIFKSINEKVLIGSYYQAMKEAKKLLSFEQESKNHVQHT